MAHTGEVVLAIDLGTSSLKAVAVDAAGTTRGLAKRAYETHRPHAGWSEQDPDDWWQATIEVVRELASALPGWRVRALSLTGQMHGTVLLDTTGKPIGRAIIWSDRRSADARDAIAADVGPSLASRIGGPLGVGYMATTLRWLHDSRPETHATVGRILLPKDALAYRLTGVPATEPSDAISTGLLNAETWGWDTGVCAAAQVDPSWLPDVIPAGTASGELQPDCAQELGLDAGIPVILAGGDAPCAAFGAGVTTPDHGMVVLSSGAQVILPAAGFAPDASGRWHTFASAVPLAAAGEPRNRVCATSNAGIALEWIADVTGLAVPDLLDRAAAVSPGADAALFIPSLTGQRTPVLDALARGTFFGLTDRHGAPQLGRAVAEGIILACRHAYATIVAGQPAPIGLRLGGGPSQHPFIRQLTADIFNLPVQPLASPDLTVLGAARSAAIAIGWPDPAPQFDEREIVRPDAGRAASYDRLFPIHVEGAEAGRGIAHALQAIQEETRDPAIPSQALDPDSPLHLRRAAHSEHPAETGIAGRHHRRDVGVQ